MKIPPSGHVIVTFTSVGDIGKPESIQKIRGLVASSPVFLNTISPWCRRWRGC